jgi:hypothetical protein
MSVNSNGGAPHQGEQQFERAVFALHGISQRVLQALEEAERSLRQSAEAPYGQVASFDPWFRPSVGRVRRPGFRPIA